VKYVASTQNLNETHVHSNNNRTPKYEKTQRLLDFGVERVIWITTQPKKIFLATQTAPWLTQNWDADVPVLDNVVLNLAGLLTEEGIEF